jgi:hypothetical protein
MMWFLSHWIFVSVVVVMAGAVWFAGDQSEEDDG